MCAGYAPGRSENVSYSAKWGVSMLTVLARDMANVDVDWEVEGIINADESVTKMLKVIGEKDASQSGTFWCWDGRVCAVASCFEGIH
jgi:hypothetical protein